MLDGIQRKVDLAPGIAGEKPQFHVRVSTLSFQGNTTHRVGCAARVKAASLDRDPLGTVSHARRICVRRTPITPPLFSTVFPGVGLGFALMAT